MVLPQDPRSNWSRVLAFAWLHEPVLKDLRQDPKTTINNLTQGGSYTTLIGEDTKIEINNRTKEAAETIREQTERQPAASYRGYLPIPNPLDGLKTVSKENLQQLLENGLTGVLKFDEEAELWAEVLQIVWNDPEKLIQIRQDPLGFIDSIGKKDQLDTKYGIFPIPDRPRGLDTLEIEDLESFLGDGDNMNHLGGIFLLGS